MKLKAPEILRDWVGRIASLEILVSKPLHKYDTYHTFLPSRRVTTESFCECLDPDSGIISRKRICTLTLPLAWKTGEEHRGAEPDGILIDDMEFRPFASVALSDVDLADEWCSPEGAGGKIYGKTDSTVKYSSLLHYHEKDVKSSACVIEGRDEEIKVRTRPIKLGEGGRLKSVRRVYLRGKFDSSALTLSIYGSRDMRHWQIIARREKGSVAALPYTTFRFFYAEIKGYLAKGSTLEGMTWETRHY